MDPSQCRSSMAAAHVVVFPFPVQGHLTCMLKLAELLSVAGLHVTFLSTDYNRDRLSRFSTAYARLAQRPGFRFLSIPDGLPDDQPRPGSRFLDLEESLAIASRALLRELLISRGCRASDAWPPVTCMIVDGILSFAFDVAEEVGIPVITFRTACASSLWCYFCIPNLIKAGQLVLPFPTSDEATMDEPVQGVPSMESFLRRRDLPSFFRQGTDATDRTLQFTALTTTNATRGRGLILNTHESLEGPVLSHIRSVCPVVYTLGPLHALLKTFHSSEVGATSISGISASMWEEDRTCMEWLDAQPHRSVIYVSFGSLTVMTFQEMNEFWHGLVNSGHRFLWVIRPDLVRGGEVGGTKEALAPSAEIERETRERGCLVAWAPQAEVLAHPAVGAFLTHGGWNSTLESIVAGVPMICWPIFADQQLNSRYISEVWKIGLDMKDSCERSIVERMVREVMEGERAVELRRSASEMAKLAMSTVAEGGSSYTNLQSLIQQIRSLSLETYH